MTFQQTIGAQIDITGVGVHSGQSVRLSLLPAETDTGVVFHLSDKSGLLHEIKALSSNVVPTDLSTVVGDPAGPHVATVEHLMAALYAMGIDNVVVRIEGRETPIMDGCSAAFVDAIAEAGVVAQSAKRRYIRVLKPVRVELNGAFAEYVPAGTTRFEVEIDFPSSAIGRQRFAGDLTEGLFRNEIASARTFGFMKDVERLWASGHALGSSLANSVVIGDDDGIINSDGLRFTDEFVRHKTLDAVGDQALAGARVIGCYRSYRGGHKLNAIALQTLLADRRAFEFVELPARNRASSRHAPVVAAAAPAFGPQTI
ncbi:UDP-3-O-acyl-N-acetylglucosamine deacetylase [Aurantimonas sp. MSK8Z-1]|uniref:UDP-3-O-acyl-N-acetylglucosamine deacetylase n=1 Tax=Mangrovibrevibacter kandeliae TaxID=2968473 RepID=UPI002117E353|nr:UDP-3-O-acyl-N-acetylglucosamine deacetylase [Aurantimonas sp. MSK8Z-1]MCW4116688.1 UDP-3-O-acyl-N-acetylglucosamine deacetylase [Aurantimonas sp. MSK8Z-1]